MKHLYLFTLLLFTSLTVCAQMPISAAALAEAGKNNFAPGIAELNTLLAKEPANEAALTFRANFLNSSGRFSEALTDATAALKINPKSINALMVAGGASVSLKAYPNAIGHFSKAIDLKPDLAIAWMMRAKTYVQTSQIAPAIKDFDELIKIDPKNVEAHLLRGRMYIRNEEPQYALKDYLFVRENTTSGSPVFEAATKEFVLAEKLFAKAQQEKTTAIKQQMLADLNKEQANNAFAENLSNKMDAVKNEMERIKNEQTKVIAVIQAASAESANLTATVKASKLEQADAREAARPKFMAIRVTLEKALAGTKDFKTSEGLDARKQWENTLISNDKIIEQCSEYNVKSYRASGRIDEITEKIIGLSKQITAAKDNKDQVTFTKARAEMIELLKKSIIVAKQGYQDLVPFNKPSLPVFKATIDKIVATRLDDLQYFEQLKIAQ